jgi:hypothetical protein
MKLNDLLKIKCKIYYNGDTFLGASGDVFSDTFKELRTYPIETFSEYPDHTQVKLRRYYNRVLNLVELREQLEKESGYNLRIPNRKQEINFVRHIFYIRARRMGYPLFQIGDALNRNHATALHGIRQFMNLHNDPFVREHYLMHMTDEEITETVKFLKSKEWKL